MLPDTLRLLFNRATAAISALRQYFPFVREKLGYSRQSVCSTIHIGARLFFPPLPHRHFLHCILLRSANTCIPNRHAHRLHHNVLLQHCHTSPVAGLYLSGVAYELYSLTLLFTSNKSSLSGSRTRMLIWMEDFAYVLSISYESKMNPELSDILSQMTSDVLGPQIGTRHPFPVFALDYHHVCSENPISLAVLLSVCEVRRTSEADKRRASASTKRYCSPRNRRTTILMASASRRGTICHDDLSAHGAHIVTGFKANLLCFISSTLNDIDPAGSDDTPVISRSVDVRVRAQLFCGNPRAQLHMVYILVGVHIHMGPYIPSRASISRPGYPARILPMHVLLLDKHDTTGTTLTKLRREA